MGPNAVPEYIHFNPDYEIDNNTDTNLWHVYFNMIMGLLHFIQKRDLVI